VCACAHRQLAIAYATSRRASAASHRCAAQKGTPKKQRTEQYQGIQSLTEADHEAGAWVVCKTCNSPQAVGQLLVVALLQTVLQSNTGSRHEPGWVEAQGGKGPHDVGDALRCAVPQPLWLGHLLLYCLRHNAGWVTTYYRSNTEGHKASLTMHTHNSNSTCCSTSWACCATNYLQNSVNSCFDTSPYNQA